MSAPDPSAQLCAFRVGQEEYAVDIARVEEVLPRQRITPLPRAPEYLEGVVHLREEILPVIDVRRRLGVPPGVAAGKEKLMICRIGRARVGLVVDGVTRVLRVERSDLKPAPRLPGGAGYVIGACGAAGALTLLFDVRALFEGRPS